MALVLFKIFDDPVAAQAAKGMLEAHDILAFVFDDPNPYPGLTLFRMRLMVSEEQYEAATDLISGEGGDGLHARDRG